MHSAERVVHNVHRDVHRDNLWIAWISQEGVVDGNKPV